MGILTSLLMPLLKTGAVIGASAIPGVGAVAGPVVGGLMSAGQGMIQGQGPLSSMTQGAMNAGMSAGMGALNNWVSGPAEGAADTSQFAGKLNLADPNMMSGLPNDPLTQWSLNDLLMRRNSFMGGRGF